MKNYNNLKAKVETIFKDLHIAYKLLDFQDDDLNYDIQINTTGKLKLLGQINGILYFSSNDYSMNLIVGNIYRIKNDKKLLSLYEILNQVNQMQTAGNFTLYNAENDKQILYRSSIPCGEDFSKLSKTLMHFHYRNFISSLEVLLEYLKKSENNSINESKK